MSRRSPEDRPKPVESFRIYPERLTAFRFMPIAKTSLYARALVFQNKRQMHLYAGSGYDWDAIARGITVRKYKVKPNRQWTKGVFAEVLFHRRNLSGRTISHEFFHATLIFARRIGMPFNALEPEFDRLSEAEERLAYACGNMIQQFVDRCYDTGLIAR